MEVDGDRLTITGTDLELTIRLTIDVGGERDGAAVVPARLVADIVKALPAGAVAVELHDDEITIEDGLDFLMLDKLIEPLAPPSPGGAEVYKNALAIFRGLLTGFAQHFVRTRGCESRRCIPEQKRQNP